MKLDRDPDRPVEHLEWRVRLFGAGAILAVVGMIAEASWLIWVAIAVLLGGFVLRFLPAADGPEEGDAEGADRAD